MPCARHGWKHKDNVTVKQRWAIRLVKDITRDSILAGQECVCSECRKEHEQLNKHYLAAKSASVDESILGKLKAKVDDASHNWMTYDPRIIAFYHDKCPFVALKLPAVVTHKVRSRSRGPDGRLNCRDRSRLVCVPHRRRSQRKPSGCSLIPGRWYSSENAPSHVTHAAEFFRPRGTLRALLPRHPSDGKRQQVADTCTCERTCSILPGR